MAIARAFVYPNMSLRRPKNTDLQIWVLWDLNANLQNVVIGFRKLGQYLFLLSFPYLIIEETLSFTYRGNPY